MEIEPCKDCGNDAIRIIQLGEIKKEEASPTVIRCCNCGTEVHSASYLSAREMDNRRSTIEQELMDALHEFEARKIMFSTPRFLCEKELAEKLFGPMTFKEEFVPRAMEVEQARLRILGDRLMPLSIARIAILKNINQSAEAEENKTGG